MVTPARAGMAGPAVDTGATGKKTNHTTDSFFTEIGMKLAKKEAERNMSQINMY